MASEYFKELDEEACAFRERLLTGKYPYLFLDAVYEKVRIGRTVVSQACVIAYGVREDGTRELLGQTSSTRERSGELDDVSPWTAESVALPGVKLVTTDAHRGLINAVATVFIGAAWQRCQSSFWPQCRVDHAAEGLP